MQIHDENQITTNEEGNNDENRHMKQFFISNENFTLLKHYQQLILQETDVFPSLRKLVNALITIDALEKAKEDFIAKHK